jgi:hypothetical protein
MELLSNGSNTACDRIPASVISNIDVSTRECT